MPQVNVYTGDRDGWIRRSAAGVVVSLTDGEVDAVTFAQDRGYLPEAGLVRHREDGSGSLRVRAREARDWREAADEMGCGFTACLDDTLAVKMVSAYCALERFAV